MTKKHKVLMILAIVFSALALANGVFCDILWSSVLLSHKPNAPPDLGVGLGVAISLVFSLPYTFLFVLALSFTMIGLFSVKRASAALAEDDPARLSLKRWKITHFVLLTLNGAVAVLTLVLGALGYSLTL